MCCINTHTSKKNDRGFTLLEVLLATLIFSLVIMALYTSFRVGTRVYRAADEKGSLLQEGRVTLDLLTRDIQSVYYMPETSYNQSIQRRMARLEPLRREAEDLGLTLEEHLRDILDRNPDKLRELGLAGAYEDIDEDDQNLLDPYQWGIPIDLKFKGKNSSKKDEVEFVRLQYNDGIVSTEPWSLQRVRYFVEDDLLLRETDKVFMEPNEWVSIEEEDRDAIPTPTPSLPTELVAEGVEEFNIYYGFYRDDGWHEAENWDSESRKHRNPMPELDPEDPDYEEKLKKERNKPNDGLPGYMFIKLRLLEPKNMERSMSFQTLVNVMAAKENAIPPEDDEDEEYDYR